MITRATILGAYKQTLEIPSVLRSVGSQALQYLQTITLTGTIRPQAASKESAVLPRLQLLPVLASPGRCCQMPFVPKSQQHHSSKPLASQARLSINHQSHSLHTLISCQLSEKQGWDKGGVKTKTAPTSTGFNCSGTAALKE